MPRPVHLQGADPRLATRATAVGLALATGLLGLTACGSSDGGEQSSSEALSAVQKAYKSTTEAGSVKVSMAVKQQQGTQSPSTSPTAQQQSVTGEALLDFENDAYKLTIERKGSSNTQQRVIKNMRYEKVPKGQRSQIPGKKPWAKINLSKAYKASYGDKTSQVISNPPADPAGVLVYLRSVSSATAQGTETIDGAQTTKYNIEVNVTQAGQKHGPQVQQQAKSLQQQLGKSTLSMQVWLDEQNRVRRLKTTIPGGQPGSPGSNVTETFTSYGQAVNVEAPASDKTADMTQQVVKQQQQLQQQMQSGQPSPGSS